MADQRPSELLAPVLERWERGDFWAWDECFAPDLLVTGFDSEGSHRARGPEEITRYIVFRFASGRLTEMHWHPRRDGALAAAGLSGEPD